MATRMSAWPAPLRVECCVSHAACRMLRVACFLSNAPLSSPSPAPFSASSPIPIPCSAAFSAPDSPYFCSCSCANLLRVRCRLWQSRLLRGPLYFGSTRHACCDTPVAAYVLARLRGQMRGVTWCRWWSAGAGTRASPTCRAGYGLPLVPLMACLSCRLWPASRAAYGLPLLPLMACLSCRL
jgi:hypothetical protein